MYRVTASRLRSSACAAIMVVVAVVLPTSATAEKDIDAQYQRAVQIAVSEEVTELRSCIGKHPCPIFHVSVFSGKFAVPNRYQLVSKVASSLRRLTFTSPALEGDEPWSAGAPIALHGVIEFGRWEDWSAAGEREQVALEVVMESCAVKLMRVLPTASRPIVAGSPAFVLTDGADYVFIVDQNPELAGVLLKGYCDMKRAGK